MSVKVMGEVWGLDLPFNKMWVLMAMADHADHEGKQVFPSLPLIAWKTGYSLASVRRIVADLRDDGILKPYAKTQFGVVIYQIDLTETPRKPEYREPENGRPKGRLERTPRKTPSHIDMGFCDTHNHQLLRSNSEMERVTVTDSSASSVSRNYEHGDWPFSEDDE